MKRIVLITLAVLIGALAGALYYYGIEDCDTQNVYALSPFCLKCYADAAEQGDSAAMYTLAVYYGAKEPDRSKHWYAKALDAGNQGAILFELNHCATRPSMAREELEKRMVRIAEGPRGPMALELSYYYLGGYCGDVDLPKARHFAGLRMQGDPAICQVSVKFAEIVNTSDKDLATAMLKECVGTAHPGSVAEHAARKALAAIERN